MRTTAGNAPFALVVRQAVLTAPLAGRLPPATRSEERIERPALGRAAAGAHARRVLRACLDELPERYRTALWLSDVERQSIQAVAAALDVTIPLATARLERARQMLSKALCRVCRV